LIGTYQQISFNKRINMMMKMIMMIIIMMMMMMWCCWGSCEGYLLHYFLLFGHIVFLFNVLTDSVFMFISRAIWWNVVYSYEICILINQLIIQINLFHINFLQILCIYKKNIYFILLLLFYLYSYFAYIWWESYTTFISNIYSSCNI
jgi:hypothetical protein